MPTVNQKGLERMRASMLPKWCKMVFILLFPINIKLAIATKHSELVKA